MKIPHLIQKNLTPFLFAGITTIIFASIYITEKHAHRQAANDPQVQMTEDAAANLTNGMPLADTIPTSTVLINESLSPFLNIYDTIGTPVTGSGKLRDSLPKIPLEVLETAAKRGEHRLSWEPEDDVRIALVIKPYTTLTGDEGFVVAGRSLRETERRITHLGIRLLAAWIISIGMIAGYWYFRPVHKSVE